MGQNNMKRLKVGLTFFYDYKGWAGGVMYTLNIISSLNLLEDALKPELYIYYNNISPIEDVKKIGYPYLKFLKVKNYPPPFIISTLSFISIKLFGRSFLFKEKPDLVYTYFKYLNYGRRSFFWIPDFQEKYLPELFSEESIATRSKWHQFIAENKKGVVVFSSMDAMNDFKLFYPGYVCTIALVRFACILPEFKSLSIDSLKSKFGIKDKFFMVTNQFWAHKNHKIILEAIALLKSKNLDFQVAFTGSTRDKRNPEFFNTLDEFIKTNDLNRYIVFLGFIEREEQLKLMDESVAIIQPSLFEGWSTVVEDAKALSQNIILSNLKVHQEQISKNCSFFDPHNATELASLMESYLVKSPERLSIDYTQNIRRFGEDFLEALKYNEL
jgi:glycosyltransferase involved in cell wall biosynthesis